MSSVFDRIDWREPATGRKLLPIVSARTPAGVPVCGALQVEGTTTGYPIVDCVARLTPESAHRHGDWLAPFGLVPPRVEDGAFQAEASVDSFGF